MRKGSHMPEQMFSDACNVSRTPVRSAFKLLEEKEFIVWRQEEGYFLNLSDSDEFNYAIQSLEDQENSLARRILSDRAERRIGDVQSVSALVRRYEQSRSTVLVALKILSRDGVVTQLPGRTWAFQPMLDSPKAINESLNFRLVVEPQAILAPGFNIDLKRAGVLREQIEELLNTEQGRLTSSRFQRLDTEFHSLIAECSGNRFLCGTLLAHHRLRRTTQKDISIPEFRGRQALKEHLDILDCLESGQFELAADQMTLHIRRSYVRRPEVANMGVTQLLRGPRK